MDALPAKHTVNGASIEVVFNPETQQAVVNFK